MLRQLLVIAIISLGMLIVGVGASSVIAQSDESYCIAGICFPLCFQTDITGFSASGEAKTNESGGPGGPGGFAVDGNLTTYWVDRRNNSYVEVELEDPQTVCHVELAWPYGKNRTWYFDIFAGNNTNDVLLFSGNSSGNNTGFEKYDVPDILTNKIKIVVDGNSKTNYSAISELKVYSKGKHLAGM